MHACMATYAAAIARYTLFFLINFGIVATLMYCALWYLLQEFHWGSVSTWALRLGLPCVHSECLSAGMHAVHLCSR